MTTYTVADRNYPTKKSFAEAVKAGRNVMLYNPAITQTGSIRTTLRELHDNVGFSFTVTNDVRRSWFAEVVVKSGRKFKVT